MVKKYAVLRIIKDAHISVLGLNKKLSLELVEGMTGAIPVFDLEADAITDANGKFEIITIEVASNVNTNKQKEKTSVKKGGIKEGRKGVTIQGSCKEKVPSKSDPDEDDI